MSEDHACPHCGQIIEGFSNRDPVSFGSWDAEKDSVHFVKQLLRDSELFTIYNEVRGRIIQPKLSHETEEKDMKIDMILSPTNKLIEGGWGKGPIGLECKRSGIKLNHPLAQVIDYSRTIWRLNNGFKFMCEYFFIWPYYSPGGLAASIMAQQKIGTLSWHPKSRTLRFKCGEQKALYYSFDIGKPDVGPLCNGNKSGSR